MGWLISIILVLALFSEGALANMIANSPLDDVTDIPVQILLYFSTDLLRPLPLQAVLIAIAGIALSVLIFVLPKKTPEEEKVPS